MTWELYLLSILNDVASTLVFFSVLATAATAASAFGRIMMRAEADMYASYNRAAAEAWHAVWTRVFRWAAPTAAVLLPLAVLVPSSEDLKQAYIMLEAPKVLNAPNAERAAKDLSGKLDRLIEALGK